MGVLDKHPITCYYYFNMTDHEQNLGNYKISVPNMVKGVGRGFRDSTLGGLNWLKGDRNRAYDYFFAHYNRVTDPDGKSRHNPEAFLDRTGYVVGGLIEVFPMAIRDLVSYALNRASK